MTVVCRVVKAHPEESPPNAAIPRIHRQGQPRGGVPACPTSPAKRVRPDAGDVGLRGGPSPHSHWPDRTRPSDSLHQHALQTGSASRDTTFSHAGPCGGTRPALKTINREALERRLAVLVRPRNVVDDRPTALGQGGFSTQDWFYRLTNPNASSVRSLISTPCSTNASFVSSALRTVGRSACHPIFWKRDSRQCGPATSRT